MQDDRSWRHWAWFAVSVAVLTLVPVSVGVGDSGRPAARLTQLAVLGLAGVSCWLAIKGIRLQGARRREVAAAEARAAVSRDRLAVAAELHDIISHGLGAITLRARAGARDGSLEGTRAALTDVARLSHEATVELRQLLTVLHEGDSPAPLRPAVGIADLSRVVDGFRGRGLEVTTAGLDVTSSPAVELLVHHVVREALTNVAVHAGPTRVRCLIAPEGERLRVTVSDEGPVSGWQPVPGSGHGLDMLRRRVAAAGGSLSHGPVGAGHLVEAVIPVGGSS